MPCWGEDNCGRPLIEWDVVLSLDMIPIPGEISYRIGKFPKGENYQISFKTIFTSSDLITWFIK
jgi:hypothetical protein